MAWASFPFGAKRAATTDPTPKKAPCGSPAIKRERLIKNWPGAILNRPLKIKKSNIKKSNTFFGGYFPVNRTNVGAPTTTPSA